MEDRPDDFSTNHANTGPLSGGYIFLQSIGSTSNVHKLVNRSRSSSDRHVEPVMEGHAFPPFALIGAYPRFGVKDLINPRSMCCRVTVVVLCVCVCVLPR